MGHLINPITFRLGVSKFWNSNWIVNINENKNFYSFLMGSDWNIYIFFKRFFNYIIMKRISLIFSHLKIIRSQSSVVYIIYYYDGRFLEHLFQFKKIFVYLKKIFFFKYFFKLKFLSLKKKKKQTFFKNFYLSRNLKSIFKRRRKIKKFFFFFIIRFILKNNLFLFFKNSIFFTDYINFSFIYKFLLLKKIYFKLILLLKLKKFKKFFNFIDLKRFLNFFNFNNNINLLLFYIKFLFFKFNISLYNYYIKFFFNNKILQAFILYKYQFLYNKYLILYFLNKSIRKSLKKIFFFKLLPIFFLFRKNIWFFLIKCYFNIYKKYFIGRKTNTFIIFKPLFKKQITASVIGNYICIRLKQKFRLRETLKPILYDLIKNKKIIGFKITCAGRFTKKQIALFNIKSKGRVSSSKLMLTSDYSFNEVILKYSVCSIKVWLNKRSNSIFDFYKYKYDREKNKKNRIGIKKKFLGKRKKKNVIISKENEISKISKTKKKV